MKKRAKILNTSPVYGSADWRVYQYEMAKEANRGHNYRYYNEEWWEKKEAEGWKMAELYHGLYKYATKSEYHAQQITQTLRDTGDYYAQIIVGYVKTKQRTKHFTVIYKSKNKPK